MPEPVTVDGAKLRVSPFNHVLFSTLHSFFFPYQKDLIALVEETFHPACKDLEARAILLDADNGRCFSACVFAESFE